MRREPKGQEGAEPGGVEGRQGQDDEGQEGGKLQDHQDNVGVGALADPDQEDAGHRQGDEDRGQVDQPSRLACQEAAGQGGRQDDAASLQEALGVAGPAHRHRRADHGVLQDQAPADDPGDQFAHARVGIGIGAARMGHEGGHLGVAEGCKGADDPGDGEGQDDAGAGQARPDAGQGIDAGADDGADPQGDQMGPAQGGGQLMLALCRRTLVDLATPCDEAHGPTSPVTPTMARIGATGQGA